VTYKSAVKLLLLGFVAASLGFLVLQDTRQNDAVGAVGAPVAAPTDPVESAKAETGHKDAVNAVGAPVTAAAAEPVEPGKAESAHKVIAYYFHTTFRCYTCRMIEAFSEEALKQDFTDALRNGSLEFRPVNVQLLENRHFINDYQLFTKSLVIVRVNDGKQVEWKNLEKVWELVGNKQAFLKYVRDEVRTYLRKG
jgi:hypothetical protein